MTTFPQLSHTMRGPGFVGFPCGSKMLLRPVMNPLCVPAVSPALPCWHSVRLALQPNHTPALDRPATTEQAGAASCSNGAVSSRAGGPCRDPLALALMVWCALSLSTRCRRTRVAPQLCSLYITCILDCASLLEVLGLPLHTLLAALLHV